MSRRTIAIAAALSVLAVGSPLITANANPLATQYFNQGVEKYEAGNYQGAIDDFNKAIEINPQDADAYNNRGGAKIELGDYQGAIDDWSKAIEINPKDAVAYLSRGVARELVYDLEGACRDWRKAADFGLKEPAEWVKNQC
ncbi:tetratricopeptide repeat protein [Synechococcus sp. CC9616]|uniref:tetratricopeptide repeat protein n=1 Tax=Synechococcus sp. CC9616 TaxID=110663 RepID=UPI0004BC9886|nr:tetratricopeptide repeat protein [Synechococcus sp. CC9616]